MDHLVFCAYTFFLTLCIPCFAEQHTGFLTRDEAGQWFLVDRPTIKSCCVHKMQDKIYLEGEFDEKERGKAHTVEGTFATKGKQKMLLEAKIVPRKQKRWPLIPLLLSGGVLFFGFTRRLFKHTSVGHTSF